MVHHPWQTCGLIGGGLSPLLKCSQHILQPQTTVIILSKHLYYMAIQNLAQNRKNVHLTRAANIKSQPLCHVQHEPQFPKMTFQLFKGPQSALS